MKLFVSFLACTALIFTGCSTEAEIREERRQERLAESSPTLPVEPTDELPGIENAALDVEYVLEKAFFEDGRLPLDVVSAVGRETQDYFIVSSSWDSTNYNLCMLNPRSGKVVLLQSEAFTGYRVGESRKYCEEEVPTRAKDTFDSLTRSIDAILKPATRGLAFAERKTFPEKLNAAVNEKAFGEGKLLSRADTDDPMVFKDSFQSLKAVKAGKGKIALAYACVVVNDLGLRRVMTLGPFGFNYSDEFIKPEDCNRVELNQWAFDWYGYMKL